MRKYLYLLGFLLLIPASYVDATDGVSGVEHPAKVNSVVTPDKVCGVSGLAAGGTACVSDSIALGDDTDGAAGQILGTKDVMCFKYQATCSGNIDELVFAIDGFAADEQITAGIYSDNAGAPGTLLGDTNTQAGTGNDGDEYTFTLDSAVAVTENTYYWICIADDLEKSTYPVCDTSGGSRCIDVDGQTESGGTMPASLTCDSSDSYRGEAWALAQ